MSVTRLDFLDERRKRNAAEAKLSDALKALADEKAARAHDSEQAKEARDSERVCQGCKSLKKALSLANDRLVQYGGAPVEDPK